MLDVGELQILRAATGSLAPRFEEALMDQRRVRAKDILRGGVQKTDCSISCVSIVLEVLKVDLAHGRLSSLLNVIEDKVVKLNCCQGYISCSLSINGCRSTKTEEVRVSRNDTLIDKILSSLRI